MQHQLSIKLLPAEASSGLKIRQLSANSLGVDIQRISGYYIKKKSIDARGRQTWILLTIVVFVDEPFNHRSLEKYFFERIPSSAPPVIIIGAGPAGLFAALKLIERGFKPILLERGKDVRSRRRDLAILNREGIIHPDSNYCFGEGGAGTYSDGKLYTRSNKRGDINRILNLFVQFGADENILYDAHPHIGTNKLPHIITAIRQQIIDCGGEVHFEQRVTDILLENQGLKKSSNAPAYVNHGLKNIHSHTGSLENQQVKGVKTLSGDIFEASNIILATGHSARDIFELLLSKNILIEAKPFALGVRIEHPQNLIDSIQYHCPVREASLPPASYSLVQQVDRRGVFSFCMCPGGIIATASTADGELVVNGWSPSKRNNPFANSGMVVAIEESDYKKYSKQAGPLAAMQFQQEVERKAFNYGGGKFVAPAQRMVDFTNKKISASLPDCSYLPGIKSAPLHEVLPDFVYEGLQSAFQSFGKKMKGYFTNEAVVVATESRTSSPVRIPRNENLEHPQVKGLYPCGEGAGYAGGIVSAAMDGERVASMIR